MLPIFQSTALSIITIFTVFVSGLYFYFTRNFNFWKKLGIPHIKPLPFVGSIKELVFLKIGIGQYLQKIYYDFKDDPYVGIFAFDQPGLVIRDLNLVKTILVKDAQIFIDRIITFNEVVDPFFGKTMFTLKGQRWRHMRVNVTPVFTSGKMKKMFCLVEKCAQELVHYLDKAIDDSK
jgi:cytochrome P450 family 6